VANYKQMYTKLFNTVTDTIHTLQAAQVETEEMFVSQKEPEITVLNQDNDDGGNDDA